MQTDAFAYSSLWNYNPRNTDEAGDEWNHENFSWFSEEKRQDMLYQRLLRSERLESQSDNTTGHSDLDLGARMLNEIVVGLIRKHAYIGPS
jgi:hypothetical protein